MKSGIFLLTSVIGLLGASQEAGTGGFQDSAESRWRNKEVLASRVLDAMESPSLWTAFTTGAPEVVDARATQKAAESSRNIAEIVLTRER